MRSKAEVPPIQPPCAIGAKHVASGFHRLWITSTRHRMCWVYPEGLGPRPWKAAEDHPLELPRARLQRDRLRPRRGRRLPHRHSGPGLRTLGPGATDLSLDRMGLAHARQKHPAANAPSGHRFGVGENPAHACFPYSRAALPRDAIYLRAPWQHPHAGKYACISLSRLDAVFSYPGEDGLGTKRSAQIRFRGSRSPPCEFSGIEASRIITVRWRISLGRTGRHHFV